METTTLTAFRKHMKMFFDNIIKLGKPLFISRPDGDDIVVMSKSEYNSMQETFHLLRSPKNAERLFKAIEEDRRGGGKSQKLID